MTTKIAKREVLIHGVFSMWVIGAFIPIVVTRDAYYQNLLPGYGQEYADTLMAYMPDWILPVLLIAAFVSGLVGGLIGRKNFQKSTLSGRELCNEPRTSCKSKKTIAEFLLDPRTKLAVLITIAVFILGGSYEGIMQYYIIVLAAIPLLLLSAARKWKGAVLYILIFGDSLCLEMFGLSRLAGVANYIAVVIVGILLRFTPQRGHGIFRGNDNHGQRICCGDGTAPPAAADYHSYVCDVSLLSHGCGRMERYWGRHADAWRPLW